MYQLSTTNQFEKDYKLCKKRNYDMLLLHTIFSLLELDGKLPAKK
jgi:mRNA interferase YafQ